MKHQTDIQILLAAVIVAALAGCQAAPAFPASGILAMGPGATYELWANACNGLHLAEMWSMPLKDGVAYMALQAHEGWFGVVLKSTSASCNGPCVQEMLRLTTGNAMTPQNLQELIDHARSLGFEKVAPGALPAAMRLAASVLHQTWAAGQLAAAQARAFSGWIIIIPNAVFDASDMLPEKVQN